MNQVELKLDSDLAADLSIMVKVKLDEATQFTEIQEKAFESAKSEQRKLAKLYSQLSGQPFENLFKYDVSVQPPWPIVEGSKGTIGRFWRDENFRGWRVFLKEYFAETQDFWSLNDVVKMTKETDEDELKKLDSSVSNALSTSLSNSEIVSVEFHGIRGRFYGLPEFFQDERPSEIFLTKLAERLNLKKARVWRIGINGKLKQVEGSDQTGFERVVQDLALADAAWESAKASNDLEAVEILN